MKLVAVVSADWVQKLSRDCAEATATYVPIVTFARIVIS